jgi:hypothetical protein
MRRVLGLVSAMVLAMLVLGTSPARAGDGPLEQLPLETPESVGDQLIYYYDARADFTTFITLRNGSDSELTLSLLFYGPTFSTPFSKAVTLAGGALTIIDVGSLRGAGLPAQPGVAIATPVNLAGQAISTGALTGNFTVANLLTGSAFGANAAARSAFDSQLNTPPHGTPLGPQTAVLETIRPRTALLAAYYDPSSLAPVSSSGNQLIFINFQDTYEPTYSATIGSTTWNVRATRANGAGIADGTFTANGVTVSDLASVAGPGVNGAAGSILFLAESDTPTLNRLVYFAESLGTFGTGYLLPPVVVRFGEN